MADFAASFARLPLAMSVFGAQQAWNIVSSPNGRKADASFYRVSEAAVGQFETSPVSFAVQQVGDSVQRSAVDLAGDILTLQAIRPDWIRDRVREAARQMVEATRALTPGLGLSTTIAALRNIFGVVNLVNQTTSMLDLPPGLIALSAAVEKAYSFGGYESLWVVEGLGRENADRAWTGAAPPKGLLTTGQGANLPEKCLLMMHAGMGISFAQRIVSGLTPWSSREQIADALKQFESLVHANAREGYRGPSYESLGLVTRTWYPQMVAPLDRELWSRGGGIVEYFWHGVGRAIYFNPVYMIPGSSPFLGVVSESPHRLALLNATAGAAWAFTLVNINHVEIAASLLGRYVRESGCEEAFANGVASVVTMASDMIPDDTYTAALCAYEPAGRNAEAAELWNRVVRSPCRKARAVYLPVLRMHDRLGEVFRYQDLDKSIQTLEGSPS